MFREGESKETFSSFLTIQLKIETVVLKQCLGKTYWAVVVRFGRVVPYPLPPKVRGSNPVSAKFC